MILQTWLGEEIPFSENRESSWMEFINVWPSRGLTECLKIQTLTWATLVHRVIIQVQRHRSWEESDAIYQHDEENVESRHRSAWLSHHTCKSWGGGGQGKAGGGGACAGCSFRAAEIPPPSSIMNSMSWEIQAQANGFSCKSHSY